MQTSHTSAAFDRINHMYINIVRRGTFHVFSFFYSTFDEGQEENILTVHALQAKCGNLASLKIISPKIDNKVTKLQNFTDVRFCTEKPDTNFPPTVCESLWRYLSF